MVKKPFSTLFNNQFSTPSYLQAVHIPSLDGLRAISILIVLCGHLRFAINTPPVLHQLLETIAGGGQLGVKLFFVISGFLITTLLIKERIKTGSISLKNFYIRRILRIFPVFYLYILVLLVLNQFLDLHITSFSFIVAALYVTNFFMSSVNWTLMHSWSLAIEEQYYLLWPSVFKKNTRLAIGMAILFIGLAPLLRVYAYYHPINSGKFLVPFIDGADSIFIGSLFAIASFKGLINWQFFKRYQIFVTGIGFLIMWFISYATLHGQYGKILLPLGPLFISIIFCLIIISNIIPSKNFFFKLFNSQIFRWIGKLSYSIYVWQQLILLSPSNFPSFSFSWNRLPLNLLLIALIAAISYYGFEKYFLKFKMKFKTVPV